MDSTSCNVEELYEIFEYVSHRKKYNMKKNIKMNMIWQKKSTFYSIQWLIHILILFSLKHSCINKNVE